MEYAQYGKFQLEGSYDQRKCLSSSNREIKDFKYYIRKHNEMAWIHLERRKKLLKGGWTEREEEESHVS